MLDTQSQFSGSICGLDEVGRGALAGPLVAGAAILPPDIAARLGPMAPLLRDSKTLTRAQRERVALVLRAEAVAWQVVAVSVAEIEARGISWANREAFRRLVAEVEADEYVVDGILAPNGDAEIRERLRNVRCQVRADANVPAVAAASILAKVWRDDLMTALDAEYPGYTWSRNVGYGTAAHIAALRDLGSTPEHRSRFVATALSRPPRDVRGAALRDQGVQRVW